MGGNAVATHELGHLTIFLFDVSVKKGDLILTIEAMKMETGLHADRDATIAAVHVTPGAQIDAKDLLVELS